MQTILSDHNCEGQARAIFPFLDVGGYLKSTVEHAPKVFRS